MATSSLLLSNLPSHAFKINSRSKYIRKVQCLVPFSIGIAGYLLSAYHFCRSSYAVYTETRKKKEESFPQHNSRT
ncbi:hypothetical protein P280DRAFT_109887 [Massarina eburnea CBS 473.64]|uniref:Uncharacterized protein n=1 Tax=Massarina eburnea CBS 473.64 TaxID=1395130 RepID=A0A6A6RPV8_9PLEO|nr:hypothetical protein P280DRAFT_109887 [Massarina eburnea CBS 473.64]